MVLPDEKVRIEYGQVPLLAVAESNMDDGCNNSHDIPIHPTSVMVVVERLRRSAMQLHHGCAASSLS
jgi:hypothetical protein